MLIVNTVENRQWFPRPMGGETKEKFTCFQLQSLYCAAFLHKGQIVRGGGTVV